VDSLGLLLDYHDCPICGIEALIEAPANEFGADGYGGGVDDERGPDRACVGCGTAVFIDPRLIWPVRAARRARDRDRVDTA
jgi:hypothetical protein